MLEADARGLRGRSRRRAGTGGHRDHQRQEQQQGAAQTGRSCGPWSSRRLTPTVAASRGTPRPRPPRRAEDERSRADEHRADRPDGAIAGAATRAPTRAAEMITVSLSPRTVARTESGSSSCSTTVALASTATRRRRPGRVGAGTTPTEGAGTTSTSPSASRSMPIVVDRATASGSGGSGPGRRARRTRARRWRGRTPISSEPHRPSARGSSASATRLDRQVDHGHRSRSRGAPPAHPPGSSAVKGLGPGRRASPAAGSRTGQEQHRRQDDQGHWHPRCDAARERVEQQPTDSSTHDEGRDLDRDQHVRGPSALLPGQARHRRDQRRVGRGRDGDGERCSRRRRPTRCPVTSADCGQRAAAHRAAASVVPDEPVAAHRGRPAGRRPRSTR